MTILAEVNTDYLATVLSLVAAGFSAVALCIAYSEYRKNNRINLKILDMKCPTTHLANDLIHSYKVSIRNNGICLHDVFFKLNFIGATGSGNMSIPIPLSDISANHISSTFSYGMIAEFCLCSKDSEDVGLLKNLKGEKGVRNLLLFFFFPKLRVFRK